MGGLPLDRVFSKYSAFPLLWLTIRALIPWPFVGILLAPDKCWPFLGVRSRLSTFYGFFWGSSNFTKSLNSITEKVLLVAASVMRRVYIIGRNKILSRSNCQTIFLLDERYAARLNRAVRRSVKFLADATCVDTLDQNNRFFDEIREKSGYKPVVVIMGELSLRRGIDLFLDTILADHQQVNFYVMIGRCDSQMLQLRHREFLVGDIASRPNVFYREGAISSEREFNSIISAADIVYCVYRNHLHSSNVLGKAAAFGKAVLVSAGGLMEMRVRDYGFGAVLNDLNPGACLAELSKLSLSLPRASISLRAGCQRYARDHSYDRFRDAISQALSSAEH